MSKWLYNFTVLGTLVPIRDEKCFVEQVTLVFLYFPYNFVEHITLAE